MWKPQYSVGERSWGKRRGAELTCCHATSGEVSPTYWLCTSSKHGHRALPPGTTMRESTLITKVLRNGRPLAGCPPGATSQFQNPQLPPSCGRIPQATISKQRHCVLAPPKYSQRQNIHSWLSQISHVTCFTAFHWLYPIPVEDTKSYPVSPDALFPACWRCQRSYAK